MKTTGRGTLCSMREALRSWEHWYSVDSSEFNRETARGKGLAALASSSACAHEVEVISQRDIIRGLHEKLRAVEFLLLDSEVELRRRAALTPHEKRRG